MDFCAKNHKMEWKEKEPVQPMDPENSGCAVIFRDEEGWWNDTPPNKYKKCSCFFELEETCGRLQLRESTQTGGTKFMKRAELLSRMGMRLPEARQIRVIVSSDVKNEADDPFAVMHQLLTPSFDVRGVVAAHFESKAPGSGTTMEQSYQELVTMMRSTGIEDVPMLRGCVHPLCSETDAPASEGVDFIIQEALREDPRPLYITVQGALTDVAAALNRCPAIAPRITVVWIGGAPYPWGGDEFNLLQDLHAARVVFGSEAALWQIPMNVYGTVEVTMAELASKVRPCGAPGRYLYEQIEAYNLSEADPYPLRKGENWNLGDSPVVAALLQCDWRGNFHLSPAPWIQDDFTYRDNPEGKMIRVYDSVDVRFLLEDFFAKMKLCWPPEHS